MIKKNKIHHQIKSSGQALIGVLAVVAIASAMVTSLVLTSLISADTTLKIRQSSNTLFRAEGAVQNAVLGLVRNPSYTGETLTLLDGEAIIEITGDNPKIITVKSLTASGKILRKLQGQVSFDSMGNSSLINWQEVD